MGKRRLQDFNLGKPKNYYILKNVFKSVLRNKIQIIGLVLLIVLMAVIFTLMYTKTQRINNSYENFITASNLHHFVVDLRNKNRIPGKEADETDVNIQKALVEKTAYVQWVMKKVKLANEANNNFVFEYREGRMVSRVIDNNVSLFKVIAYDDIQNTIDKLVIIEGRNIETEQEVVLSPGFANENKYNVGDIICLQSKQCDVNNGDNNALKIVGLGTSVDYMFPQLDLTMPIPNQTREGIAFVHPHQLGLFSPNNTQLIEKGIKWQYNKSVEKISLTSEADHEGYFVAQWVAGTGGEQNISLIQKQLQDYFLSNDGNNNFVFAVNDANYVEYDFSGRINMLKSILIAYQIMTIALLLTILIISGFMIALVTKKNEFKILVRKSEF